MKTFHQEFSAKPERRGRHELITATFTFAEAKSMWALLDATSIAQDRPRDFRKWKRLRDKFALPPNKS